MVDLIKVAESISETYSSHDAASLAGLFADEFVLTNPYFGEPLRSKEVYEENLRSIFLAFPDIKYELNLTFTSGNYIAYEGTYSGTFSNPLASPGGEIPPTEKEFEMKSVGVAKVTEEGLIEELREYFDSAILKEQLDIQE